MGTYNAYIVAFMSWMYKYKFNCLILIYKSHSRLQYVFRLVNQQMMSASSHNNLNKQVEKLIQR